MTMPFCVKTFKRNDDQNHKNKTPYYHCHVKNNKTGLLINLCLCWDGVCKTFNLPQNSKLPQKFAICLHDKPVKDSQKLVLLNDFRVGIGEDCELKMRIMEGTMKYLQQIYKKHNLYEGYVILNTNI